MLPSRAGVLMAALAAALIVGGVARAAVFETDSATVPGVFDPVAAEMEQLALNDRLIALEAGALPPAAAVRATAADLERLRNAPEHSGALLVGVTKELGVAVRGGDAPGFGERRSSSAGPLWLGVVRSPGATAIRLHLTGFNLPRGASLYVYNELGEAFGPITLSGPNKNGDVWTNTVRGDEIRLQVHFGNGPALAAQPGELFTIQGVVHLGERFLIARLYDDTEAAFCSFNASCVQNANCASIPSAISGIRNGIAHLQFNIGSSAFICSGGLLNDTVSATTIPYLLTANHCFSTQTSATSLEAYFQFSTPCNGSCYNPDGVAPRTLGSTLLATNATSDYTLVRLSGSLPAGSVLLGWNTTAVANTSGTALYRISHPKGAPQAYSTHNVNTTAGTCSSWPRGPWIYSNDTLGATEGGSSGSPVLIASGQVVGQLSGACGATPSTSCDGDDRTVDGALAAYFSSVSQYLNPTTGCSGIQYTGSLTSGQSLTHGQGTKTGTITGTLTCSGPDFDLFLDRRACSTCAWVTVASSESAACNESINYSGTSATYRWRVLSFSGSGSYSLCVNK